jgi:hypothetical protein
MFIVESSLWVVVRVAQLAAASLGIVVGIAVAITLRANRAGLAGEAQKQIAGDPAWVFLSSRDDFVFAAGTFIGGGGDRGFASGGGAADEFALDPSLGPGAGDDPEEAQLFVVHVGQVDGEISFHNLSLVGVPFLTSLVCYLRRPPTCTAYCVENSFMQKPQPTNTLYSKCLWAGDS